MTKMRILSFILVLGFFNIAKILIIVQLGLKLNTKLGLNHHHPPGTFQRLLGIVGG